MRVCVVGGDERLRLLAELFKKSGFKTGTWGQGGEDMPGTLYAADAVVLPFPRASRDGFIPAPMGKRSILVSSAAALMGHEIFVMAGTLDSELEQMAEKKKWRLILPGSDPDFEAQNAMPSAEGAIYAAMQKANYTLCGSRCLIIGPGRLGMALGRMLLGLGAHVAMAGRRPESLAPARELGMDVLPLAELPAAARDTDILFNTAPAPVAGEEVMASLPAGALAIDLASAPFGIDLDAAGRHGVVAWREGGIPGKYAPLTAARLLYDYFAAHVRSEPT